MEQRHEKRNDQPCRRLDDSARLDSLLIYFPPATAEPPASGGRPDLDMALDIFRCYNLTPNPRHYKERQQL
jgi:hypothetical protein